MSRIRLRGNWSVKFWIFVAMVLVVVFVVVPWLIQHPPPHPQQHTADTP